VSLDSGEKDAHVVAVCIPPGAGLAVARDPEDIGSRHI
jgi:hypothetical protein